MKNIMRDMLKIYVPVSGLDWLNYKLVKEDLSFHHIVKKCDKGKKRIENGAILQSNNSHPYLHLIETMDIETYIALNEIFLEVNKQKREPDISQRYRIEEILQLFENKHRWDKGCNGNILIKKKYLDRW